MKSKFFNRRNLILFALLVLCVATCHNLRSNDEGQPAQVASSFTPAQPVVEENCDESVVVVNEPAAAKPAPKAASNVVAQGVESDSSSNGNNPVISETMRPIYFTTDTIKVPVPVTGQKDVLAVMKPKVREIRWSVSPSGFVFYQIEGDTNQIYLVNGQKKAMSIPEGNDLFRAGVTATPETPTFKWK